MGNFIGCLGSPSIEIYIPSTDDERDILILRLRKFYDVNVRALNDRLKVSGHVDLVAKAEDYALRFRRNNQHILITVLPACMSVFNCLDLVRHFEERFQIFIFPEKPASLKLRGDSSDVAKFQESLKVLECLSQISPTMTPLKYNKLHVLCRRFSIDFHKLPSSPAIQSALLTYFSNLDSSLPKPSKAASKPLQTNARFYRTPPKKYPERSGNRTLQSPQKYRYSSNGRFAPFSSDVDNVNNAGSEPTNTKQLRPVVIDGSNVAFAHGRNEKFSPEGIRLAVEFFTKRGHENVVAFVPQYRQGIGGELFKELEQKGHLHYTPSRWVDGTLQASDDDRLMLQLAAENNAVIVSNDQFRNYLDKDEFRDVIKNRLPFVLRWNTFIIPNDPHGRNGPSLSQCLQIPSQS